MREDRDPRPNHAPVDQAGVRQYVPPARLVLGLVGLGLLLSLLMLAAAVWAELAARVA